MYFWDIAEVKFWFNCLSAEATMPSADRQCYTLSTNHGSGTNKPTSIQDYRG